MENWLIYTLVGIGLFIISLFFEVMREFYEEMWGFVEDILGDIFGDFGDGLFYVISFEWVGDIPEFFSSMFDDLGEFSVYGLTFALIGLATIYFTRSYMIEPFVKYYSPVGQIFWTIATYVTVFIGGYLMGKYFENTS